jgi:hypothetical protein
MEKKWICSMEMDIRQGHEHAAKAAWTRTCSMDMDKQYEHGHIELRRYIART